MLLIQRKWDFLKVIQNWGQFNLAWKKSICDTIVCSRTINSGIRSIKYLKVTIFQEWYSGGERVVGILARQVKIQHNLLIIASCSAFSYSSAILRYGCPFIPNSVLP